LELRLIEAQLRSDEALRLQDGEHERAAGERLRLRGGWREWVRCGVARYFCRSVYADPPFVAQ
jgi:hypothetical protein